MHSNIGGFCATFQAATGYVQLFTMLKNYIFFENPLKIVGEIYVPSIKNGTKSSTLLLIKGTEFSFVFSKLKYVFSEIKYVFSKIKYVFSNI